MPYREHGAQWPFYSISGFKSIAPGTQKQGRAGSQAMWSTYLCPPAAVVRETHPDFHTFPTVFC